MKLYIYSDGHLVHAYDANSYDHQVISGALSLEFNRSGSLTFTVPRNNEAYKNGWIKDLDSVIEVYNASDNYRWRGRVLGRSSDMINTCTFTCEGVLGRLNDVCAYPIANTTYFIQDRATRYTSTDPAPNLSIPMGMLMKYLIGQYNDRLSKFRDLRASNKSFRLSYDGSNPFIISLKDYSIANPNFENMLDYIQNNVLQYEKYGYRIETGIDSSTGGDIIYLRSNSKWGTVNGVQTKVPNFTTSSVPLLFGRNLTNFSYKTDYSQIYTAMHFRGTLTIDRNHGDLEEETQDLSYPADTVKPDFNASGYASSEYYNRIKKYGLIMGHEELNGTFYGNGDAAARQLFEQAANERLETLATVPVETIEISGLNIHGDEKIQFRPGYYIPVISKYHGIQAKYLCTAAVIDICSPGNSTVTLGSNINGTTDKWIAVAKQDIDDPTIYY